MGIRRARVLQLLVMQGLLSLLLVAMAVFARHTPRTMAMFLWTLVVPAGFAFVYGTALLRHERARAEGRLNAEWEKKEARRGFSLLGGVFLAWIVGVLVILAVL